MSKSEELRKLRESSERKLAEATIADVMVTTKTSENKSPTSNIVVLTESEVSKKICDWINSHKEFKWSVMCKTIGLDKGNFKRTLDAKSPSIKSEVASKIEEMLKKYGYDSQK